MFKTCFLNAAANWRIYRQPSYAEGQAHLLLLGSFITDILYSINIRADFLSALTKLFMNNRTEHREVTRREK